MAACCPIRLPTASNTNYYTTLKGVMEKENPQNPTEFTVPEKLKELYAARDFGRYANAGGELPVAFLADCDITAAIRVRP